MERWEWQVEIERRSHQSYEELGYKKIGYNSAICAFIAVSSYLKKYGSMMPPLCKPHQQQLVDVLDIIRLRLNFLSHKYGNFAY